MIQQPGVWPCGGADTLRDDAAEGRIMGPRFAEFFTSTRVGDSASERAVFGIAKKPTKLHGFGGRKACFRIKKREIGPDKNRQLARIISDEGFDEFG